MKRFFVFYILITILASCSNDSVSAVSNVYSQRQRFSFCTLESCNDKMSAVVMVNPRPEQTKYIMEEPDQNNITHPVVCYSIDKSNWVVRIRLVAVPSEVDMLITNKNSTINRIQMEYCASFDPPLDWTNVVFTAAKVTSDIIITADCELYGRPAGTNLADKFLIPYFPKEKYSDEQHLVSYDEHTILADLFEEDSAPMALTDYFFPGVMVHRGFWLRPAEVYEEDPEIIHFHVEYDAWTDLFEPYADFVGSGFVQKGSDRHLYADFVVDLSSNKKVQGWNKNTLWKYPW
ncbi:MAG: hypothetical protein J5745_02505 [Bacteroidales bacterium]|nr:hypothetical protein [Bacteroidales bacterium]